MIDGEEHFEKYMLCFPFFDTLRKPKRQDTKDDSDKKSNIFAIIVFRNSGIPR